MSLYFSFDVESIGLHGEGFAVGWVVGDRENNILDQGCCVCNPDLAQGNEEDRLWVNKNVVPVFQDAWENPLDFTMSNKKNVVAQSPWEVRQHFWLNWFNWRGKGALLLADCAYPVENNFLERGIEELAIRAKFAPYPLLDVSNYLLAVGKDPTVSHERLESELPQHHPLCDAKQSLRLFLECMDILGNKDYVLQRL